MTPQEVSRILGKPDRASQVASGGDTVIMWVYADGTKLTFRDGKLLTIATEARPKSASPVAEKGLTPAEQALAAQARQALWSLPLADFVD